MLIDTKKHALAFREGALKAAISIVSRMVSVNNIAGEKFQTARCILPVLTASGARFSDPDVAEASKKFTGAVSEAQKEIKLLRSNCGEHATAIKNFGNWIKETKPKIQGVEDSNQKYLPNTDDIQADYRNQMEAAYNKLNELCAAQNQQKRNMFRRFHLVKYVRC